MKKIKVLSLFLVIVLTLAMFAGCGKKDKVDNSDSQQQETVVQDDSLNNSESTTSTTETSQTLESFLKSNEDYMKQVKNSVSDENMTVDIQGNTVVYVYDFSKMEGVDKDTATSSAMKEQLDSALDQYSSTFSGLCSTLEGATKIDGIKILVKYVYGDTVISEKEFAAN